MTRYYQHVNLYSKNFWQALLMCCRLLFTTFKHATIQLAGIRYQENLQHYLQEETP